MAEWFSGQSTGLPSRERGFEPRLRLQSPWDDLLISACVNERSTLWIVAAVKCRPMTAGKDRHYGALAQPADAAVSKTVITQGSSP